ncbi:hypothetical protein HKBW3S42_01891, partial [Candidatus Hakubella thermalkaliphila]
VGTRVTRQPPQIWSQPAGTCSDRRQSNASQDKISCQDFQGLGGGHLSARVRRGQMSSEKLREVESFENVIDDRQGTYELRV